MRRQRNNIAVLPFEMRLLASKLLFEGQTHAQVAQALAAAGAAGRFHDTTFAAWRGSAEYLEYCTARKGFEDKTRANRLAAMVQNDGRGPESLADIAEYEILRQLTQLAQGGLLETGKDVATVANAIRGLRALHLARAETAKAAEIQRLTAEHAAETQALEEELAEIRTVKDAEISRLAQLLTAAGIDPAADAARSSDGLSPSALKQIEEKAKLL
jgi:hypothetical protein